MLDETTEYGGFVGGTFSLSCVADGVPLPDITWLKDDCPLTWHIEFSSRIQTTERVISGFRAHVPEAKESVLTVEESMEHDSGSYSCQATNALNTVYLPSAHQVTVNGTVTTPQPLHTCTFDDFFQLYLCQWMYAALSHCA